MQESTQQASECVSSSTVDGYRIIDNRSLAASLVDNPNLQEQTVDWPDGIAATHDDPTRLGIAFELDEPNMVCVSVSSVNGNCIMQDNLPIPIMRQLAEWMLTHTLTATNMVKTGLPDRKGLWVDRYGDQWIVSPALLHTRVFACERSRIHHMLIPEHERLRLYTDSPQLADYAPFHPASQRLVEQTGQSTPIVQRIDRITDTQAGDIFVDRDGNQYQIVEVYPRNLWNRRCAVYWHGPSSQIIIDDAWFDHALRPIPSHTTPCEQKE